MKKVFSSHSDVCHKFNEQSQSEGRAGSIFFYDNKIYSYGYHYLLGEFISQDTILINDKGYSSSTAKHISILTQATRDKKQIYLSQIELNLVLNELESLYKSLLVARKPEKYYNSICWLSNNFNHNTNNLKGFYLENKYYEGFQFIPINGTKNWKQLTQEHKDKLSRINEIFSLAFVYSNSQKYLEKVERARELEETKAQREKEKREKQRAEQIENFNTYKGSRINWLEFDLLRISKCGEFVETSQAVKIPIKEAQRYYKLFKSGAKLVGERISQYTTISNENYLQIGCHKIEHSEANRIGELILNK